MSDARDELMDVIAETLNEQITFGPDETRLHLGAGQFAVVAEAVLAALVSRYGEPEIGTDLDYDDTGDERAGFKLNANGDPLLRRRLVFPWQVVNEKELSDE